MKRANLYAIWVLITVALLMSPWLRNSWMNEVEYGWARLLQSQIVDVPELPPVVFVSMDEMLKKHASSPTEAWVYAFQDLVQRGCKFVVVSETLSRLDTDGAMGLMWRNGLRDALEKIPQVVLSADLTSSLLFEDSAGQKNLEVLGALRVSGTSGELPQASNVKLLPAEILLPREQVQMSLAYGFWRGVGYGRIEPGTGVNERNGRIFLPTTALVGKTAVPSVFLKTMIFFHHQPQSLTRVKAGKYIQLGSTGRLAINTAGEFELPLADWGRGYALVDANDLAQVDDLAGRPMFTDAAVLDQIRRGIVVLGVSGEYRTDALLPDGKKVSRGEALARGLAHVLASFRVKRLDYVPEVLLTGLGLMGLFLALVLAGRCGWVWFLGLLLVYIAAAIAVSQQWGYMLRLTPVVIFLVGWCLFFPKKVKPEKE